MDAPPQGWPPGAPARDVTRSPAAARVGRLAAESHLRLFHYEYRVPLDAGRRPRWRNGVLPERKYGGFRHDLAVGSFHPGHRSKWTTHELCHALVGFGWREDATPLYLATAARLAELLPVVLWYFLDEAWLTRCGVHERGGALFRAFCPDCERAAAPRPDDPDAHAALEGARTFLDRELSAVARTRRLGRPVPHVWATLDLTSDGLAYAEAHGARLRSDAFRRYAAGFLVEGEGWARSLDDLEERVLAVAAAIGGADLSPLAPDPWRWVVQDVGWRLWSVWQDTEGEAAQAIADLADGLARDPDPAAALQRLASAWRALEAEYVLPEAEDVLAVGYPLPGGVGRSIRQLEEGIASFAPLSARLLDLSAEARAFAAADAPWRAALPTRVAARAEGPTADLLRWEAVIATLAPADRTPRILGTEAADDRLRLAPGARLLRVDLDVLALAEAVERGEVHLVGGRLVRADGAPWPARPTRLLLGPGARGDVEVLEVSEATADAIEALGEGAVPSLAKGDRDELTALGLLVPAAWRC